MSKKNKCYKVVLDLGDKLVSMFTTGKAQLTYPPGEVVRPNVGKILVFRDLGLAQRYAGGQLGLWERFVVWECECGKLEKVTWVLSSVKDVLNQRKLHRFWNAKTLRAQQDFNRMSPPRGTMATDWVVLKREVSRRLRDEDWVYYE